MSDTPGYSRRRAIVGLAAAGGCILAQRGSFAAARTRPLTVYTTASDELQRAVAPFLDRKGLLPTYVRDGSGALIRRLREEGALQARADALWGVAAEPALANVELLAAYHGRAMALKRSFRLPKGVGSATPNWVTPIVFG